MKHVIKWFNSKLLTVNINKTKIVPFTSYENHLPTYEHIQLDKQKLEISLNTNYLGISLDSFLRWDIHLEKLKNKIRSIAYKFYKCRQILSIEKIKTIYYALVCPLLSYGIIGWGGVRKTLLKSLEVIQKRILKIMSFKPARYPSSVLFAELKIFDVRQIYAKTILVFTFNRKKYLRNIEHIHQTRSNSGAKLIVPRVNKSIGKRTFSYLAPKLFNQAPENIKKVTTKHLFKKNHHVDSRTRPVILS